MQVIFIHGIHHSGGCFFSRKKSPHDIIKMLETEEERNFQKYFQKCGREMAGLCVSLVKNKEIDNIRRAKEAVLWENGIKGGHG